MAAENSLSIAEVKSEVYDSAQELADALGFEVFEPSWWPEDVGRLNYRVEHWLSGPSYSIGSVRGDSRPVLVLGGLLTNRGSPPSDGWRDLPELPSWSGQVRDEDFQTRGLLHSDTQRVQVIGLDSAEQLVRVVNSFRRSLPAARP